MSLLNQNILIFLIFKFILLICILTLFNKNLLAEDWTKKFKAYSTTDNYLLSDGSKIVHYKNKGLWEDSLGNYGTQTCLGTIALNQEGKIVEILLFCQGEDHNGDKFTTRVFRETDMVAGTGKYVIIDGTGLFKGYIGAKCTYAVSYFKDALFDVDKCSK